MLEKEVSISSFHRRKALPTVFTFSTGPVLLPTSISPIHYLCGPRVRGPFLMKSHAMDGKVSNATLVFEVLEPFFSRFPAPIDKDDAEGRKRLHGSVTERVCFSLNWNRRRFNGN